ncbi:MAG: hypothetical protein MUC92_00255 [Fimbriimonadaceae bacterium]|jgi:phosphotriesterase-related protein|nr:hypothetical protein [Fimbriimonadaceae bacterium]
MSFFRSVLGDIPHSLMGVTYSHEHLWLNSPRLASHYPELLLRDFDLILAELDSLFQLGVQTCVDAMPGRSGRDTEKLKQLSKQSQVSIIASTGVHLEAYYQPDDPVLAWNRDDLARYFLGEIEVQTEESPAVRAGCIKLASSGSRLTDQERERFIAGAIAQAKTGCPILTHTEKGEAALEQVEILLAHGAVPEGIILSHLDRRPDPGYHREVLSTGVTLEYDSCFRWSKDKSDPQSFGPEPGKNPTLDLLVELLPEYPVQFVIGMDAAKSSLWESYGGTPGHLFLITKFKELLHERGLLSDLIDGLFILNPARAYRFHRSL